MTYAAKAIIKHVTRIQYKDYLQNIIIRSTHLEKAFDDKFKKHKDFEIRFRSFI